MATPAAQLGFDFAAPRQRSVKTPAARRTDPISSHLAADQITASGTRGQQQAMAAAAVRAFPGCTSFELAMKTGQCRFQLARRLPECVTGNTVRKGELKTCSVTGHKAIAWFPVQPHRRTS